MVVRLSYVLAGVAAIAVMAAAVPAITAITEARAVLDAPPPSTGHLSPTPSPGTLTASSTSTPALLPAPGAPLCSGGLTPVDIGRAPDEPARGTDLDDRGRAGGTVNLWSSANHEEKPFLWSDGTLTVLDHNRGGYQYGQVVALNNRGEALGTARPTSLRIDDVVLWDAEGVARPLNATNVDGRAYDLNDQGQALVSLGGKVGVWSKGRFTAIPVPAGRTFTEAKSLNERGQAIGRSDAPNSQGTIEAWVWDGTRTWELTSPYGRAYDQTIAVAQNDRGQVVGYSISRVGFKEPSVGWLWEKGKLTLLRKGFIPAAIDANGRILGTLQQGSSRQVAIRAASGAFTGLGSFGAGTSGDLTPLALNDHGQVLVYAGPGANVSNRLWLWEAGRATALRLPVGFQYVSAIATLNERGEVLAAGGLTNYQEHSVLWRRACGTV